MARLIVNLNTGDVFQSFSEAGRALGVDPSNIRKVVSGERRTAGGYTFAALDPEKMAETDLGAVKRQKLAGQTSAQKKRATESRRKSRQKVQQRKKAEAAAERQRRKTEPPEVRAQRKRTRDAMQEANKLLRQAGGLSTAGRKDLEDLARQLGATKDGAFKVNSITGDARKIAQAEQRIKEILSKDTERKKKDAARWADVYRLRSQEDAEEARAAFDNIAKSFERLRGLYGRVNGRGKYRAIFEDVQREAEHMTPEQIQEVANLIDNYLNDAGTPSEEELLRIYRDWAESEGIYEEDEEDEDGEFFVYE